MSGTVTVLASTVSPTFTCQAVTKHDSTVLPSWGMTTVVAMGPLSDDPDVRNGDGARLDGVTDLHVPGRDQARLDGVAQLGHDDCGGHGTSLRRSGCPER